MTRRPSHHCLLFCVIAACLCWATLARAAVADDLARAAFRDLHIVLVDGEGAARIVEPNMRWRIVRAASELKAFYEKSSLASGITDATGEARLSANERRALFEAWQQAPTELWFIRGSNAFELLMQSHDGRATVALVQPESEIRQELRRKYEADAAARARPLSPSKTLQVGFDAAPFQAAYEKWRARFSRDLDDFNAQQRADPAYGHRLLDDTATDALRTSFATSIDDGPKGLDLRRVLIAATHSTNSRVTPTGAVIAQLLLSDAARPVGFGVRDGAGDVRLYGMSRELASIAQNVFGAQIR